MKKQEKRRLHRRLQEFDIAILVRLLYSWKHQGSNEGERGFLMAKSALKELYEQLPAEAVERVYIESLITSILYNTENLARFMVKLEERIQSMPTDDPDLTDSIPE